MKFEMAPNSLFAILLRSSWWISMLVAAGIVALSVIGLPPKYVVFGAVGALPFVVIGAIALWRQLQRPSEARVAATVAAVADLSWADFSAQLSAAFQRDGYEVLPATIRGADLELRKAGRRSLLAGRRWKAARTGIEPLRELVALREAREVDEVVFVATGEITGQALAYAAQMRVRLIQGPELALLLGRGVTRGARLRSA
ncbi:MAG: restriction endonuclease [Lautropia sp.]